MIIDALVLAAGRSTRMGRNKLLELIGDRALIRHSVDAVLSSKVNEVFVVTGHQESMVREALQDAPVHFVHNSRFADGLSTSLQAGIAALSHECDAVIVLLGDMPLIDPAVINALISTSCEHPEAFAIVPVFNGEWGNPVLMTRRLFHEIGGLQGDAGARKLLLAHRRDVIELPVMTDGVMIDLDTPEVLEQIRARGIPS